MSEITCPDCGGAGTEDCDCCGTPDIIDCFYCEGIGTIPEDNEE